MYMDDAIHIEKTDQCYTCEHFMKGVMCPLLEALALGIVELNGDVAVQNCGFYQQFQRHLRVVEHDAPESAQGTELGDDDDNATSNRSCL